MRKFAISDIHGHARTFKKLVQDVIQLEKEDTLYLLGDYVDRGPDVKGVIDFIFKLMEEGYDLHCLKGNHEVMMLNGLEKEDQFDFWWINGGEDTAASFGDGETVGIPERYTKFLDELPLVFEVDDYFMVHASLDFQEEDIFAPHDQMMWLKHWYDTIDYDRLGHKIILHGHTTEKRVTIESMLQKLDTQQYLCIDNGCYKVGQEGMGSLCAFDLDKRELYFQENIG